MKATKNNLEEALKLVSLGFTVIPLAWVWFSPDGAVHCSCKKAHVDDETGGKEKEGKHPCVKFDKATKDPDAARALWTEFPHAGIGIITGAELPDGSFLVVLDTDPRHGGGESFEALLCELGPLPDTATALSGRGDGGNHQYFRTRERPATVTSWRAGVDVLAQAGTTGYGLVVAPPSQHRTGGFYVWEGLYDATEGSPIAELPARWVDALKAPKRETRADGKIFDGERARTLFRIGRSMQYRGCNEEEIRERLAKLDRNLCVAADGTSKPLGEAELERRVFKGLFAGGVRPAQPEAQREQGVNDGAAKPAESTEDLEYIGLSDAANSQRFASEVRGKLLYCVEQGWCVYRNGHWQPSMFSEESLGMRVMAGIVRDTEDLPAKKASELMNAGPVRSMISLARSSLAVRITDFDADPWLFNVQNGTLDLRTRELGAHRPEDRLTKSSPVVYDATATAPTWRAFLERVLPDANVRAFVQRLTGYWLTGVVREHTFPVFWGGGGNGKGVFFETIRHVMGEYASAIPSELLMQKKFESHPTDQAQLKGLRLAAASETKQGQRLDENLVKVLTGGDRVKARFMRQDFFEFEPTHKLALRTNHKPIIVGTDRGIWRRFLLVPWTVDIPKSEDDTSLGFKLRSESPGILNWALEGCTEWQRLGLAPPPVVQAATEEFRAESDVVGRFVRECCTLKIPSIKTQASVLFAAFENWAKANGERGMSQKAFCTELSRQGFEKTPPQAGRNFYRGIGLLVSDGGDGGDPRGFTCSPADDSASDGNPHQPSPSGLS